jgi:hypothetical protein
MELSSPRFRAFAVTIGFSFWFFIISNTLGVFSLEIFSIFVISVFIITQLMSIKLSKALDVFAILNTKVFLGILFIFIISVYGILFRMLKIDLLRSKSSKTSYWLDMEILNDERILKQY